MKKIILASDYSDTAGSALDYAVALANKFGARLSLVSAVNEPYSAAAGALVSITEKIREEAHETLSREADRVRGRLTGSATVDTHTVDGAPGSTIPRVAAAKGYDLIVTGTHGSSDARELFTGSVANALIKHSEIPVLVVPVDTPPTAFARVLVADDGAGGAGPQDQNLLNSLATAYGSRTERFHDESGDPAAGIAEAVRERGADLLVMTYHPRGVLSGLFTKSTVTKVAFDLAVPLLVLR